MGDFNVNVNDKTELAEFLAKEFGIGTSHYEQSAKADDVRLHMHRSRLPAQYEHRMHTLRLIFQLLSTLAQSIVGSVVKLKKEKK
jgi:hypothetical protein